ncbi:hypothetical protein TYRP_006329 [Tyrophagus putrescentiae]|nr:hypothetical protein TYRP_006329 [Tyrophagus putrescentiae]
MANKNSEDYSVLRWGVAGAGKISTDFVCAVNADSPDKHKFVAVASRSLETASNFAFARKIPTAYGSYQELAQDTNVQIVYIGNLNPDHFETAKLFLEHGKHVLLEKPLTMNAKQTAAITELAREKNLLLMEALWSRFLPAYVFLAEQLKAKTIGEIYSVEASFGFANLDAVARVSEKKLGGGTILDLGVYTLNLIQMAFGNEQPEKVAAVGALNSSGVDASVAAALSYSGGRSAVMRTHSVVEMPNTATLIGTKGTIRLEKYFHCAQKVLLNGQEHAFPYPANTPEMNFPDGRGLRF